MQNVWHLRLLIECRHRWLYDMFGWDGREILLANDKYRNLTTTVIPPSMEFRCIDEHWTRDALCAIARSFYFQFAAIMRSKSNILKVSR